MDFHIIQHIKTLRRPPFVPSLLLDPSNVTLKPTTFLKSSYYKPLSSKINMFDRLPKHTMCRIVVVLKLLKVK